jgi:hypothetical protein
MLPGACRHPRLYRGADHQEDPVPHDTSDDDRITLTPISRPDPAAQDNRRRRRTFIAGAVAVIVVAGGISWWVVSANTDHKPVKHTAVLPATFGGYTEAKPGDTEWGALGDVNTDITKGSVDLTYRAPGGKAAMVTVELDPPIKTDVSGGSDDALSALFGTDVTSGEVRTYPAGTAAGKIQCANISVGPGTFTKCAWQNSAANVTLSPVLDHHTVVAEDAATDLRAFLDALKVQPK